MQATVFNRQETPSGLYMRGEPETEEISSMVASLEFSAALPELLISNDAALTWDHLDRVNKF